MLSDVHILFFVVIVGIIVIILRNCKCKAKAEGRSTYQQSQTAFSTPPTRYNRIQSPSTNRQSQSAVVTPPRPYNRIQSPSLPTQWGESDHEVIFGTPVPSHLQNVSRFRSTPPPTPPTQTEGETAEQLHYANFEAEYERRAQERRDLLDSLNNFVHMPPRLDTNNGEGCGITNERLTDFSLNPSAIESYDASAPLDPIFIASIGATAPLSSIVIESREAIFENNDSCTSPAPQYTSGDEGLPSYEAATSNYEEATSNYEADTSNYESAACTYEADTSNDNYDACE